MRLLILSISLFLLPNSRTLAQNIGGDQDIDDAKVTPWDVSKISDYQGSYHLGDSEWEYHLTIIICNDTLYAQIRKGSWSQVGEKLDWVWTFQNLTMVNIVGNRFYSKEFNGQFATYDNGTKKINGIKKLESDDLHKNYEFGYLSFGLDIYFNGKFNQASKRYLTKDEISNMSKSDLQIMRNEIFARYGYKFISGGKMDTYFKKQSWYRGQHKNVDSFITDIERANITLIKQIESKK